MRTSAIKSIVTRAIPRALGKPRRSLPGPWLFSGTKTIVVKVENSIPKFFTFQALYLSRRQNLN